MNFALLRKTANDACLLLLACFVTVFAFSWIRVIIVASMQINQFQRVARSLPEFVQRLSPVPIEELINYPGLLAFTFEEPIVYLIMAVWSISRASDCVSGELGRGTLELILAQPISRRTYLVTHSLVTLTGIALLAVAAYAGTSIGINTTSIEQRRPTRSFTVPLFKLRIGEAQQEEIVRYVPVRDKVDPKIFRPAAVNYACLGVFLAGITTALSALDRYRWRTIGLVVGFYVVETVIELTGMAVEGCRWMLKLTFFSVYEPVAFVTGARGNKYDPWGILAHESSGLLPDLGPLGCDAILVGLGLAGFICGLFIFVRRDLPAPL